MVLLAEWSLVLLCEDTLSDAAAERVLREIQSRLLDALGEIEAAVSTEIQLRLSL